MTLISPRFPSGRLRSIDEHGSPLRRGARGRPVHLVQQALVDLGHAMPKSTGNVNYSPDGIFGREMQAKLKEFQSNNSLEETGIVDRDTIRKLDRLLKDYQYRVKLHFRTIAEHRIGFERSLKDALIVYGQYGIKVEFGSGQNLGLTPAETALFDKIGGECNWTISAGEMNQLHGMGGPAPHNEILVFYVKEFTSGLLGCGGHATSRPAVTVAATSSRWDTAHEVGHVLLGSRFAPVHISDRRNLMHETAATYSTIPVLTNMQVDQMRKHVCCVAI
jgi:hypothetical protein